MIDMTANEREFIHLFRDADETGKMFILQTLACFLAFGNDFYNEMKKLQDKGDKEGMMECAARWYTHGCEMFGVERMTI